MQKGINNIKKIIRNLPNKSGVYKMISKSNEILYIGKAKSLFKRVSSYTNPLRLNNRLQKMISLVEKVEFITTEDETKALLLEASLIKEIKPKFNILLKDDKTYPNIELRVGHKWPQIKKHSGKKSNAHLYFGPFASAYHVNVAIDTLQKIFSLRTCSDYELINRKRPCIQYQINRCSAPCTGQISLKEYDEIVNNLLKYMKGKNSDIVKNLIGNMNKASKDLNFEKAASLRDKIRALQNTNYSLQNIYKNISEADVFSIVKINNRLAIEVTFCRNGQNFGSNTHFLEVKIESDLNEILQKFIVQFYSTQNIPKKIIVSHEIPEKKLIENAFFIKTNRKLNILNAVNTNIKQIIDASKKKAEINLAKKIAELDKIKNLLEILKNRFNFPNIIRRIEVYDNSHFSGKDAVGSFIVAGEEGFVKDNYRKFNIKFSNPQDDYAMMEEVLQRRLKYGNYPDLIIIDGGKGQLSKVKSILTRKNLLHLNLLSISKGKERNAEKEKFFCDNGREIFIERNDPLFYYLLRLRDEAHRFAISNHKTLRKKKLFSSEIDMVPNVGVKRKKNLLLFFKDINELKSASLDKLIEVPGINKSTAKLIYNFFNEG